MSEKVYLEFRRLYIGVAVPTRKGGLELCRVLTSNLPEWEDAWTPVGCDFETFMPSRKQAVARIPPLFGPSIRDEASISLRGFFA